jgi:hypothetical protein
MTVIVGTPYVSTASAFSHTITIPAVTAGNIILVLVQLNAADNVFSSAGFTILSTTILSNYRSMNLLAKVAVGNEGPSLVMGSNQSRSVVCHPYVIDGTYADLSVVAFANANGNGFENPPFNPPALTPAGGLATYHWFVGAAIKIAAGFTSTPAGYAFINSENTTVSPDRMRLYTGFKTSEAASEDPVPFTAAANDFSATITIAIPAQATGPDYTQRKSSTFTATHTLGTITTATLNAVNVFDHVSSQAAGTISFTGSVTDERTTSGVVDLVLGDGAATQTQTVQVNVFGVVPSNNPAQKDGSALASLTGIQIRITAGANLNGNQVYYSPTETTDASGNFSTLDVSTSAAVAADPVRMQVLTAGGDSITSAETVGLI